jgi:hypothetical protein
VPRLRGRHGGNRIELGKLLVPCASNVGFVHRWRACRRSGVEIRKRVVGRDLLVGGLSSASLGAGGDSGGARSRQLVVRGAAAVGDGSGVKVSKLLVVVVNGHVHVAGGGRGLRVATFVIGSAARAHDGGRVEIVAARARAHAGRRLVAAKVAGRQLWRRLILARPVRSARLGRDGNRVGRTKLVVRGATALRDGRGGGLLRSRVRGRIRCSVISHWPVELVVGRALRRKHGGRPERIVVVYLGVDNRRRVLSLRRLVCRRVGAERVARGAGRGSSVGRSLVLLCGRRGVKVAKVVVVVRGGGLRASGRRGGCVLLRHRRGVKVAEVVGGLSASGRHGHRRGLLCSRRSVKVAKPIVVRGGVLGSNSR